MKTTSRMSRERNHGALSPANEKGLSGELLRSMVGSLILCRLGRKSETGEAATLGGLQLFKNVLKLASESFGRLRICTAEHPFPY